MSSNNNINYGAAASSPHKEQEISNASMRTTKNNKDDKDDTTSSVSDNLSSPRLPVELVENTYEDIKNSFSQILLIKLWWRDIGRRVGSHWHHATLFNGSLLLPIAVLAYTVLLEVNPPEGLDQQFRHYIAASMAVALVAQFFFSFNGICFENAAMLLAANVVAAAVAARIIVRPLLDYDGQTGRKVERIVLESVIGVLTAVHFITSFMAWHANDGFRRFIFFAIGGTSRIQSRYRVYQSWVACSRIDLLFTTLTCLSIGFFCQVLWWHYFFLALVVIVNAIWRSMLLRTIRTETCIADCFQTSSIDNESSLSPEIVAENSTKNNGSENQDLLPNNNNKNTKQVTSETQQYFRSDESNLEAEGKSVSVSYTIPNWCSFFLVAIINMNSPFLLGFALFSESFVQAEIPEASHFLVFLSFAIFVAARVLLTIATIFAWRNFGKGMKDVFAKERGVAEYLLGTKSMHSRRQQRKRDARAQNPIASAAAASSVPDDDSDEDPFAAAARSARAYK